ncbi:putative FBD-associated F-box protein At3g50710 [Salvia miltiorrhiza]|uniref:putative FBD-associated F-box protein At3g50710 n=1 Tax=Salvia miltiorrhiza TaxID=226208 RepID=UPI0025ACDDBC|nr:putative FBD-associated F-box protein At3g50710 [Salvia miltiorrhiza]
MECSRRCDGGVHRISELPDEIVLVILSFLSLRESVTTSVLSSRWLDLWKHIPNLNLDAKLLTNQYKKPIRRSNTWYAEMCKYIEIVNSVLQPHKAPWLKEFRISLIADKSAQCAVTKWLEFVLSRQVERLELDLQCQGTCIKVSSYVVSLEELLKDRPQNLIGFKSLKSLCLKGFNVSGEAIDSFQRYTHHRNWYLRISQKLVGADFDTRTRPAGAKHFARAARLQFLTLDLFYPDVFFANAFPQIPMLKNLAVKYSGAYEHGLFPVTALIRASPRLQVFRLEVDLSFLWCNRLPSTAKRFSNQELIIEALYFGIESPLRAMLCWLRAGSTGLMPRYSPP